MKVLPHWWANEERKVIKKQEGCHHTPVIYWNRFAWLLHKTHAQILYLKFENVISIALLKNILKESK